MKGSFLSGFLLQTGNHNSKIGTHDFTCPATDTFIVIHFWKALVVPHQSFFGTNADANTAALTPALNDLDFIFRIFQVCFKPAESFFRGVSINYFVVFIKVRHLNIFPDHSGGLIGPVFLLCRFIEISTVHIIYHDHGEIFNFNTCQRFRPQISICNHVAFLD